jgi:hypothetical protein
LLACSIGAVAALLVMVFGPVSAWAHDAVRIPYERTPGLYASIDPSGRACLLLAAILIGTRFGLRRPRGLVAGVAIVFGVFAVETGVHSVHHMGDPIQAAACTVAAATAHLVGNPVDVVGMDPIIAPALDSVPWFPPTRALLHRPSPHEGRAPPASTV